jgi:hypothetical protein
MYENFQSSILIAFSSKFLVHTVSSASVLTTMVFGSVSVVVPSRARSASLRNLFCASTFEAKCTVVLKELLQPSPISFHTELLYSLSHWVKEQIAGVNGQLFSRNLMFCKDFSTFLQREMTILSFDILTALDVAKPDKNLSLLQKVE